MTCQMQVSAATSRRPVFFFVLLVATRAMIFDVDASLASKSCRRRQSACVATISRCTSFSTLLIGDRARHLMMMLIFGQQNAQRDTRRATAARRAAAARRLYAAEFSGL